LYTSTLCWSAERGGVKGYVVAGHIGTNRIVPIGTIIYQSTYPTDPAGAVRAIPTSPYYADAAFVEFNNVAPKIYLTSDLTVSVNWHEEPHVNMDVHKSGLTTGLTRGKVEYVNVDENPLPIYGTLYDQALARIEAASGDSGAPFYVATAYGRGVVGILSGPSVEVTGLIRFSPPSGIETETGSVPLTTYP
jgi:hypothetical protein